MSDERLETVDAIIADWRDCVKSADPSIWDDERIAGLVHNEKEIVLSHLDRIVAAWKREREAVGNAAAMREAMEEISSVSLGNFKEPIDGDSSNLYQDARYKGDTFVGVALPAWVAVDWYRKLKAVKEKAEAALSAPPRQCDVGTAEEQGERCLAQFDEWRRKSANKKLITAIMEWGQTPYAAQEGGAE